MKKYNILVPLAGRGQRMIDGGYSMPKPLIFAGDRRIIDYSLDSIDRSQCNLIFVVRRDHVCNFSIDKALISRYGEDIKIVITDEDTRGSVESCYLARSYTDDDQPLIICTSDIYFEPVFTPSDEMFDNDGYLLTFKANSSNYSYAVCDEKGYVIKTAEKMVISDNASVGIYCFKNGKLFNQLAKESLENPIKGELYLCPIYNKLIEKGGKVKTSSVDIMYIMGTPNELKFFKEAVYPYFLNRSFILCSDHSGYELKEYTKMFIKDMGISFIDCGCCSLDDCDYSDYIPQAIETRRYYPGALILGFCRSGQGVNICANKFPHIRSALIHDKESASLAIRHNAANFFAVSSAHTSKDDVHYIISTLMTEKFEGGRHQNRLQRGLL